MKLAVITTGALGWQSVGKRWRQYLPSRLGLDPLFLEIQDFEGIEARTPYLRRLAWLRAALRGRRAAKKALGSGCDTILLCTNADAALLPLARSVRYLVYGDATQSQLDALYYNDLRTTARKRWVKGRISKLATAGHSFLCMSNWYRDAVIDEYGALPGEAILLPPLLDTDLWAPLPNRSCQKPLKALFVGGDFERKGGDVVLSLAHMIPARELEWEIVTNAQNHCGLSHVRHHTDLTPDSPALAELVTSCRLMVFPTRADCSPNAILEASAAGLPVVATAVGGISDMIDDRVTGSLMPYVDVDCFYDAVIDLISWPERLRTQGEAARAKVIAGNSIDAHMAILTGCLSISMA